MNKISRALWTLVAAAALCVMGASQVSAQTVGSLRGADVAEPALAPGLYRTMPDGPPLPRDYVQQPPLIPHKIDGYEISLNFNKCMDCHSWTRYRASGATKVSITHFKDRDANELSNISPRRYFCVQCHVPQTDARPLVENIFKPATGVR